MLYMQTGLTSLETLNRDGLGKDYRNGEGKRRNEFAEWHVAWLAEWHSYAEFNIRRSFSKK